MIIERDTSLPRRYLLTLCGLSLFVLAFPMAVWELRFLPDVVRQQTRAIFSVGLENNIGAWWCGALLFLAAVHAMDGFRRYRDRGVARLAFAWLVMACVMIALSLDETGSLHERVAGYGGWWGLLPFGIVLIASVTWASWQMWTDPAERQSIKLVALAFACFAATALNEFIEHAFEWPASLRPWRTGFEEGIEIVGMLILVAAAMHNSGGAFMGTRSGERERPCLWLAHSMPAWVLLAILAVSPFFAVLSAGLHDMWRGRPADWLASMMFLLAALAAWRPVLCLKEPERYPGRIAVGLLLLAASASCVALYPQWYVKLGVLEFNVRLSALFVLLLSIAVFTWLREYSSGLRLAKPWLGMAGLAVLLALTTRALLPQQLATMFVAILAYTIAVPGVRGNVASLLHLRKRAAIGRT